MLQTVDGEAQVKDTEFKAGLYTKSGRRLSGGNFFKWECDEAGHVINAAVFSVPATEEKQSGCKVRIEGNAGFKAEIPTEIRDRIFELDLVPLNKALTEMRTAYDPQKTAEAQKLYAIYGTTGSTVYTTETFSAPLPRNTRRTSPFGDERTYRYADGTTAKAIHAGIDYGSPTGTEVFACAGGHVVLARPRIVTGNSVIIEHYPGVYSIYYHLDSISAVEGSLIEGGELLGAVGATGLATGPHLHWEIRVSGENTNPDTMCDMPLLNTELLGKHLADMD
jgi:murein DD-endopeptidase MepM/ murein hydrolase activator NlpD